MVRTHMSYMQRWDHSTTCKVLLCASVPGSYRFATLASTANSMSPLPPAGRTCGLEAERVMDFRASLAAINMKGSNVV